MKFIKDVILNFISSMLLVFMIQVLYFPIVGENETPEQFGTYIYIYTVINFWAAVIGGVGNSIYLKYYSEFKLGNSIEEYRRILGGLLITFTISLPLFHIIIFNKVNSSDFIIITAIIIFVIHRIYLTTWYRSLLKYNVILLANLASSFVYGIMLISGWYEFNFFLTILIAEFSFTIFILLYSKRIYLIIPKKFNSSYLRGFIYLLFSFLAVTAFKYIDKWFVEFQFNEVKLTYFYIAAITSTLFTGPITTISNVLFSYFVQRNELSLKTIYKTITFVLLAPILIIIAGHLIGPIIINILYEQYYANSIELFYVLNIAFGLLSVDFILRGFVIKFFPEYFKMIMDIIMILILVISMFFLANIYGLIGVAYSILVTYLIKAIINLILLIFYYKRIKKTTL